MYWQPGDQNVMLEPMLDAVMLPGTFVTESICVASMVDVRLIFELLKIAWIWSAESLPPVVFVKATVYLVQPNDGVKVPNAYSVPDMSAQKGTVMSQEKKVKKASFQLMFLKPPDAMPTPIVAPTMQFVVETGMPLRAAMRMVMAEPISMQKPPADWGGAK